MVRGSRGGDLSRWWTISRDIRINNERGMLRLSEQTVGRLDAEHRRRVLESLLPVLRSEFPELWARWTDAEILDGLVQASMDAERYRLYSADGVHAFFSMRLRLGADFPE